MRIRAAIVPTLVTKRGHVLPEEVTNYLPSNYVAMDSPEGVLIVGYDRAAWTLDGYVIPRLASGLIFAQEVTP